MYLEWWSKWKTSESSLVEAGIFYKKGPAYGQAKMSMGYIKIPKEQLRCGRGANLGNNLHPESAHFLW